MGFIGNKNGPRKSIIVSDLGEDYFGITKIELLKEIEFYLEEESYGEIDPVYIDKSGRAFLIFKGSRKKLKKFYIDLKKYTLEGKVKAIINNIETEIEL